MINFFKEKFSLSIRYFNN